MKTNFTNSRKVRYGGVTFTLTALTVAAIILVNVIFSALASRFSLYIDMTPDFLYTVSDSFAELLENGEEKFESESPINMVNKIREENKAYNTEHGLSEGDAGYRDEDLKINIIFCDERDIVTQNSYQRYVHDMADKVSKMFPDHVELVYHDIIRNPSAVTKYKSTSTSNIYSSDVIVEFGTEFRIFRINAFYRTNSGETEPWAFDGEKKLAGAMLAVTRAESPIACITKDHGETENTALRTTLEDAGFKVQDINLATDQIPANCRLMVIFNPNADFKIKDGISEIDELAKLDAFLDATNSMMVFMSPDSPALPNFEEYLEEWGISFDRTSSGNFPYVIQDTSKALSTDGYKIIGDYAEYGLGGAFTESMRSVSHPKNVIFPRAMSISFSDSYSIANSASDKQESSGLDDMLGVSGSESKTPDFDYAIYNSPTASRTIYDLFISSSNARAMANGSEVARATEAKPFKLMTVSMERRSTQDSNYMDYTEENSYVIACGSTEFASEALLYSSSYGNGDLLLSSCRYVSQEPVPVGISLKPFADYTIDNITTAEATRYTVVLTTLPALAAIIVGAVVLIRRKNK